MWFNAQAKNVLVTVGGVTVRGLMLPKETVPSLMTTSSAFKTQRSVRWSRVRKSEPNHTLQGEQKTYPHVKYMILYVVQSHIMVLKTSHTKPTSLILFGPTGTVFGGMEKIRAMSFFWRFQNYQHGNNVFLWPFGWWVGVPKTKNLPRKKLSQYHRYVFLLHVNGAASVNLYLTPSSQQQPLMLPHNILIERWVVCAWPIKKKASTCLDIFPS